MRNQNIACTPPIAKLGRRIENGIYPVKNWMFNYDTCFRVDNYDASLCGRLIKMQTVVAGPIIV